MGLGWWVELGGWGLAVESKQRIWMGLELRTWTMFGDEEGGVGKGLGLGW